MNSAHKISSDLAIFIAKTWKAAPENRIDFEKVCRIWAYDLGWFDINKSQSIRNNLIEAGWLEIDGDCIRPSFDLEGVEIPFSWMPSMRILENPPKLNASEEILPERSDDSLKIADKDSIEQTSDVDSVDPATSHIKPLLKQISNLSKMDVKEILRRAQRKRRALGPVTLWMALLLVAREQRLSMPELIQILD